MKFNKRRLAKEIRNGPKCKFYKYFWFSSFIEKNRINESTYQKYFKRYIESNLDNVTQDHFRCWREAEAVPGQDMYGKFVVDPI